MSFGARSGQQLVQAGSGGAELRPVWMSEPSAKGRIGGQPAMIQILCDELASVIPHFLQRFRKHVDRQNSRPWLLCLWSAEVCGHDAGSEDLVDVVKRHLPKSSASKIKRPKIVEIRRIATIAVNEVNPDPHFSWLRSCDIHVSISPELSSSIGLLEFLRVRTSQENIGRGIPDGSTCLPIPNLDNDLLVRP